MKMKITLIAVVSLLIIAACSDKSADNELNDKIEGITVTDATGNVLSLDPDDWQCSGELQPNDSVWRCIDAVFENGQWVCSDSVMVGIVNPKILPGSFCLSTAYPNPTDDYVSIEFVLPVQSEVLIWVRNDYGYVDTLLSDQYEAGVHVLSYDMTSIDPGLYRVIMEVESWSSYGDIQLVNTGSAK